MRKRIAVFGNSLFQDIKFENNKYVTTKKQTTIHLSKLHDIDNYSMESLTMDRAFKLIQALPLKNLYQDCIIALGEADGNQPEQFKSILFQMIEYLQANNIRPLLVSLPEEMLVSPQAYQIQSAIDEAAVYYNVDYIHEGKTNKMVSYVVSNDCEMLRAITDLC